VKLTKLEFVSPKVKRDIIKRLLTKRIIKFIINPNSVDEE